MIGFITGLRQEARLLTGFQVFVGGGLPGGAHDAALRAIEAGATALVSFGVAGGLDPLLQAGAIVRPGSVAWQGCVFPADAALTAALGGQTAALIATGTAPAVTSLQKNALHHETGAAAIDLESGPVAALAARHNLPFAALRAICDTASQDLPRAALVALGPDGRLRMGRIVAEVLCFPGQLPALIALGRHATLARAALTRDIAKARSQGTLARFG